MRASRIRNASHTAQRTAPKPVAIPNSRMNPDKLSAALLVCESAACSAAGPSVIRDSHTRAADTTAQPALNAAILHMGQRFERLFM